MKWIPRRLLLLSIAIIVANLAWAGNRTVYVHGYHRKDGTYVSPYYRSAPGAASQYPTESRTTASAQRTVTPVLPSTNVSLAPATVHVQGYYRQDGTLVQSYDRATTGTAAPEIAKPITSTSTTTAVSETSTVHVRQHRQRDGMYVQEYVRSAPGVADTVVAVTTSHNPVDSTTSTAAGPSHLERKSSVGVQSHDRIKRNETAKREFMRMTGYPNGRPGYVVDHIVPLKRGGCDCPENMQWQTIDEAKAKDKWE